MTVSFPPDSRNPRFDAVLRRMWEVHMKKNLDYADEDDPYSNFTGAAHIAGLTSDQGFLHLVGIKVERLRQLVSGKEPNFESLDDSILDLANYAALWLSYRTPTRSEFDQGFLEATQRHNGEVPPDPCGVADCYYCGFTEPSPPLTVEEIYRESPSESPFSQFSDLGEQGYYGPVYFSVENHPMLLGSVATGNPPKFIRCEAYPKCFYCGPTHAEVTD